MHHIATDKVRRLDAHRRPRYPPGSIDRTDRRHRAQRNALPTDLDDLLLLEDTEPGAFGGAEPLPDD